MTKIPTEILLLAQKGGWRNSENSYPHWAVVALDREFWESLGRKLGWPKEKKVYMCKGCQTIGWADNNHMNACLTRNRPLDVMSYAHQFYDLILRGQDPTEFWAQLIANK